MGKWSFPKFKTLHLRLTKDWPRRRVHHPSERGFRSHCRRGIPLSFLLAPRSDSHHCHAAIFRSSDRSVCDTVIFQTLTRNDIFPALEEPPPVLKYLPHHWPDLTVRDTGRGKDSAGVHFDTGMSTNGRYATRLRPRGIANAGNYAVTATAAAAAAAASRTALVSRMYIALSHPR